MSRQFPQVEDYIERHRNTHINDETNKNNITSTFSRVEENNEKHRSAKNSLAAGIRGWG